MVGDRPPPHGGRRRESYLSFYGPLSVLLLLAAWALSLILAFALVQWGLGIRLVAPDGGSSSSTST